MQKSCCARHAMTGTWADCLQMVLQDHDPATLVCPLSGRMARYACMRSLPLMWIMAWFWLAHATALPQDSVLLQHT